MDANFAYSTIADACQALARHFSSLAYEASTRRERASAIVARQAAYDEAARAVAGRVARGEPLDAALQAVGPSMGLDPLSLEALSRHAVRQALSAQRQARNRQICALARAGLGDAAIGARLALHPKTVSRIVREGKEAPCPRPIARPASAPSSPSAIAATGAAP